MWVLGEAKKKDVEDGRKFDGSSFPKEKVVGGARKMYIHGTFLGFFKNGGSQK